MRWVITPQQKIDADALAYLDLVEKADGQVLEADVRTAVINFVTGCKADNIWDAIKASCILAGARTLAGALVPLVGTAPTNFNFVSGNYNRKTGLVGDGSTKYLNSNRNNNADPQNNKHVSIYISAAPASGNNTHLSGGRSGNGDTILRFNKTDNLFLFHNNSPNSFSISDTGLTGFVGSSRSDSANYSYRHPAGSGTVPDASEAPRDVRTLIFARSTTAFSTAVEALSLGRFAFYSIGESLDLALLDARVTQLITDYANAIP